MSLLEHHLDINTYWSFALETGWKNFATIYIKKKLYVYKKAIETYRNQHAVPFCYQQRCMQYRIQPFHRYTQYIQTDIDTVHTESTKEYMAT